MRKNYKEFEKRWIGCSDIAAVVMVGGSLEPSYLYFGEDGSYMAYVCDEEDVEIGSHYKLIKEFNHWMRIYDDESLVFKVHADVIKVYRAGEFGVIIHYFNKRGEERE